MPELCNAMWSSHGRAQAVLPPGTDIVAAYRAGSDDEQAFVQYLALFFTSYYRVRCSWVCVRGTLPPGPALMS